MLATNIATRAQTPTYTTTKDPDDGTLIFNGPVAFKDLDNEKTFTWLKEGREGYRPNEEQITYLCQHLSEYTMVVFLGTWCEDSHELVPKLEKVLQSINYPADKLTMYGTDRAKKTKGGIQKNYHINLVPTIILFSNGKEAGRITESVKKDIETDLVSIIQKDQKHKQSASH